MLGLSVSSAEYTNIGPDHLEEILKSVQPWPGFGTNYPSTNWVHLIAAARIVQKSSSNMVEQALLQYQWVVRPMTIFKG
jgi:hypothetical protein